MSEEEIRKMLNTEIKEEIKLNLDSALIFTYVQALEKENAELKQKYSDEEIRNTIINRYREVIEKEYISKDKIRDKIKEIEDDKYEHLLARENIIKTLEELLGV